MTQREYHRATGAATASQEGLFQKISHVLQFVRREDGHAIRKGDVLVSDDRNHVDLAGKRLGAHPPYLAIDLNLGERTTLEPFNKNEIKSLKASVDRLFNRLLGRSLPEETVA